ncbi:unnamed protein product [Orchesella dallaii]|uniref:C2H2-type domain-containing protein n=1 Tax=Orchesella dallaii TaxID=48710 RepID=A0ABP1PIZ4_9HEXA
MEPPVFCPVCGDNGVKEISSSRLSSSGRSIFQCFLNLFGFSWKGKNFPFCNHCKVKLQLITQIQEDIKELEKKLKEHETELGNRLHGSEKEFQKREVYSKDGRYLKLRRQIVKGDKISSSTTSTSRAAAQQSHSHNQLEVEYIKVEVDADALSFCDDDEQQDISPNPTSPLSEKDPHSEEEINSSKNEGTPPPTNKRRRVPPQRFVVKEGANKQERKSKKPKVKPATETESQKEEKELESDDDDDYQVSEAEDDKDSDSDDVNFLPKPRRRRKKGTTGKDNDVISFYNIRLDKITSENGKISYKCSKCSLILPNKNESMRSHVAREHTTLFSCSTCEKRFHTLAHLNRHVNHVHSQIVKEIRDHCPICEKPFTRLDHMKSHLWTHKSEEDISEALAKGEKPPYGKVKTFQCKEEACGRMFSTNHMLNKHIQKQHVENVPERGTKLCGVCGMAVRNIHVHIEMRHKPYEERRYCCSLCGKKFAFSAQLCNHRKQAHATDKPWKCEVCGKDFKLEKYFIEHRRGHEDVKPFECHLCGMGFTRGYVLKRHISNVHEGAKRKKYAKKLDTEMSQSGE